ncbi:MAG TPA: glycosyltransferase [Sphingomonas sp.]|nr:glycosyltransferase [Sphingomonas sp.]
MIVFVINSIGSGGAERALDTILRAAGDRQSRYEMHLVLLDREPEMRVLPALDGRHCLDTGGSLWRSVVALDRLLARLKPDLVVSLLVRANLATAIAGRRHAGATVLCERMHLGSHLAGRYRGVAHAVLRLLPRLLYPRADRVLAVSEGVRDDLIEGFGLDHALVAAIPNGYDLDAIAAAGARPASIDLPDRYAVAVGRLVAAKGFALLVEAWRMAQPAPMLLILGEGPERAALAARIAAAGLSEHIRLLGFLGDPFPIVARAQFLVSASHNEGFPNGIAEAMALSRPIVATDCPSGPAELLGAASGAAGEVVVAPHGLIVPDGDAVALAAAVRMMADAATRERLADAARARMDDFTVAAIAGRYWAMFDALLVSATVRVS